MNKLKLASRLLKSAALAIRIKSKLDAPARNKAICTQIHLKQVNEVEHNLVKALKPMFEEQVKSAGKKLQTLKSPADNSKALATQVFNPDEWQTELVNRALPVLAVSMIKAAYAQMAVMGVDVPKLKKAIKASTASEWIENYRGDPADITQGLEDVIFSAPFGDVSLKIATELPSWMKEEIVKQLENSFSQDYWSGINATSFDQIETYLKTGLQDGWSITQMAENIATALGGERALARATSIARTESGNALNGARSMAADGLMADLSDSGLPMKKVWHSVLGSTTRADHANLDGVPVGDDNRWNLTGYKVRWPGDIVLPPGQRCNCFLEDALVQGNFTGAQRVWYEGTITEIVFRVAGRFSVTPNHPIVSSHGVVSARSLQQGDKVVAYCPKVDALTTTAMGRSCNNIDHKPAPIKQVFQTLLAGSIMGSGVSKVEKMRSHVHDFYGDGKFMQGDIDVIRANWKLLENWKSLFLKKIGDTIFVCMPIRLIGKLATSYGRFFFKSLLSASRRFPSICKAFCDEFIPIGSITPSGSLRIGRCSDFDAVFLEISRNIRNTDIQTFSDRDGRFSPEVSGRNRSLVANGISRDSFSQFDVSPLPDLHPGFDQISSQNLISTGDAFCNSIQSLPSSVFLDEVVDIRQFHFRGHVYDLQSELGYILAKYPNESQAYIATLNCQCTILVDFGMDDDRARELLSDYADRISED